MPAVLGVFNDIECITRLPKMAYTLPEKMAKTKMIPVNNKAADWTRPFLD